MTRVLEPDWVEPLGQWDFVDPPMCQHDYFRLSLRSAIWWLKGVVGTARDKFVLGTFDAWRQPCRGIHSSNFMSMVVCVGGEQISLCQTRMELTVPHYWKTWNWDPDEKPVVDLGVQTRDRVFNVSLVRNGKRILYVGPAVVGVPGTFTVPLAF